MANTSKILKNLSSLFILLLFHLSCFTFHKPNKIHNTATTSFSPFKKKLKSTKKTISSFLTRIFTSSATTPPQQQQPPPPPSMPSPSSSTRSLSLNIVSKSTPTEDNNYSPVPNIFPCSICGEVFQSSVPLDHHKSAKHAVSDLIDGGNIVRIIFKTGWPVKSKNPNITRILKIHNCPKIINQFEEYREIVKYRASITSKNARCIADGNELLRFQCTTFVCDLNSSICSREYCSVCGIIRNGFSPKLDGISTMPTSWSAHVAVPEDLEEEFGFMHVKRALLVCRVIAGRVGCDPGLVDKEDPGFDSLMGRVGGAGDEEELVVFNPRAVLPCFVIVYTV